jgi:predicted RNA-binding Zn-ribbon protein involved in translation (DUF1610 family)
MGFFRKAKDLKSISNTFEVKQEAISATDITPVIDDRRVAACPYCGIELAKTLGSATKCKSCGNKMFVRTDHRIEARLVVTQEEADQIDDANEAIAFGEYPAFKNRVDESYAKLRECFGTQPSYSDVRWLMANEDILKYSNQRDYGLLRNNYYRMAEISQRNLHSTTCISMWLTVFYFDQCEPNNMSGMADDPKSGISAWGPVPTLRKGSLTEFIDKVCQSRGLTVEQAAMEFEDQAERFRQTYKMPRSWSDIWPKCL